MYSKPMLDFIGVFGLCVLAYDMHIHIIMQTQTKETTMRNYFLTVGNNKEQVFPEVIVENENYKLSDDKDIFKEEQVSLYTKEELDACVGASYSIEKGILYCNGSLVCQEWTLTQN